jgi:6-phosphogluconolactonase
VPWDKIYFFWGDERHVPPDHPDSNFRMANEALLSKVPVPAANIFRIPAENPDASAAAQAYEETLRKFFGLGAGEFPRFDLILLGIGPEGHTASLFPETAALQEKSRLVVANWVEKLKANRITMTLPVFNAAREVAFLVSGTDKAPIVHEALEGKNPEKYPCRMVEPNDGKLIWFVDRAAASELASAA